MKSKDYKEAVESYTKSLALCDSEPFTYANRAMAYLKLKDYRKCIEDANAALKLKPGYLKALHRRGKAHAALNMYFNAIKDFQEILELEPDNREVNKDLMDARYQLNQNNKKATGGVSATDLIDKKQEKTEQPKSTFKRIAIEESDEEDEEPTIVEVGGEQEE